MQDAMESAAFAAGHDLAGECLTVHRLALNNFRNYGDLALELPVDAARPVVLYGGNGAGKTNLLEALSYLAPGRGLRGARLQDVAKIDGNGTWAVSILGNTKSGHIRIGTGLVAALNAPRDGDRAGDRRTVRIDGEGAAGPAVLSSYFSIVWLTPRMDRLFLDAQSGRRKFFDQMVCGLHPDHARHIGSYERTMRERIKLLSDGYRPDPVWLSALEKRMAEHGVAVAAARNDALSHLAHQIDTQPEGAFPKADIALDGFLEALLSDLSALEVEEHFAVRLEASRSEDARSHRTGLGPHRTDLLVTHRPKVMPARLCSTGEQKALMVGLVLADARMQRAMSGYAPMLLMDEVSAHLDDERRAALFDELTELGSQAWLTGTDAHLFQSLKGRASFFYVDGGILSPDD